MFNSQSRYRSAQPRNRRPTAIEVRYRSGLIPDAGLVGQGLFPLSGGKGAVGRLSADGEALEESGLVSQVLPTIAVDPPFPVNAQCAVAADDAVCETVLDLGGARQALLCLSVDSQLEAEALLRIEGGLMMTALDGGERSVGYVPFNAVIVLPEATSN